MNSRFILFFLVSVNNRARILLEEELDNKTVFEADEMTKNWYRACMNETRIEELGLNPLLESLENVGGWQVLDQNEIFEMKS